MKKIKKTALMIILIYIIINLVLLPEKCITAARIAISLCLDVVIPALFPFFIASSLFISLGYAAYLSRFFSKIMRPVFNVSGSGALAMVLGIISGYPIGAATSARLYKSGFVSKSEAERLLAFTNNSGPVFVLGALGTGILSSPLSGGILYASHIIAALICGIVFRFYGSGRTETQKQLTPGSETKKSDIGTSIADAINFSVDNMLKVCGFVVLFSVICALIPSGKFYPYIYSLFEITGGLSSLAAILSDEAIKLPLLSFFLSFSGISVMCQVASIVIPAGLSLKPYFLGKLLQGIFSFYITKILLLYFTEYKEVSTVFSPIYKKLLPENMWHASIAVVLFALILFTLLLLLGYFLENNKKR